MPKQNGKPVSKSLRFLVVALSVAGTAACGSVTVEPPGSARLPSGHPLPVGSARVEITETAGSQQTDLIGAIDFRQQTANLRLSTASGLDPSSWVPDQRILVGGRVYTSVPAQFLLPSQVSGRKWLSSPLAAVLTAVGTTSAQAVLVGSIGPFGPLVDPAHDLAALRPVTVSAQEVGHTRLKGIAVTGYRLKLRSSIPAHEVTTIWLDAEARTVRLQTSMNIPRIGSFAASVTYWDFGTQVSITAPPQDEVVTMQQLPTLGTRCSQLPGQEPLPGVTCVMRDIYQAPRTVKP